MLNADELRGLRDLTQRPRAQTERTNMRHEPKVTIIVNGVELHGDDARAIRASIAASAAHHRDRAAKFERLHRILCGDLPEVKPLRSVAGGDAADPWDAEADRRLADRGAEASKKANGGISR
jgi:hypothetical protein